MSRFYHNNQQKIGGYIYNYINDVNKYSKIIKAANVVAAIIGFCTLIIGLILAVEVVRSYNESISLRSNDHAIIYRIDTPSNPFYLQVKK